MGSSPGASPKGSIEKDKDRGAVGATGSVPRACFDDSGRRGRRAGLFLEHAVPEEVQGHGWCGSGLAFRAFS